MHFQTKRKTGQMGVKDSNTDTGPDSFKANSAAAADDGSPTAN